MFLESLVSSDHASPKGIIFILLPKKRQNSILKALLVMISFLPKNVRWGTFCKVCREGRRREIDTFQSRQRRDRGKELREQMLDHGRTRSRSNRFGFPHITRQFCTSHMKCINDFKVDCFCSCFICVCLFLVSLHPPRCMSVMIVLM